MTEVRLAETGTPGMAWASSLPHRLVERVMGALGWQVEWYATRNSDGVPGMAWRWSR